MQLQYIGARYVPIWYTNSNDQSANWQINVEYEPLTFVTDINNHLYLSKKTVPDNIGDPADNTEYWLDMGIFTNAQIAQLQQEVEDMKDGTIDGSLQSQINDLAQSVKTFPNRNTLNKKRWIFLGDSYAEGAICTGGYNWDTYTYSRNYQDGWMYKLINNYLQLDNDQYYDQPTGGASFSLEGGQHWQDLLNALVVEEPDTIDYIVVLGGANDFNSTRNEILLGMQAFKNVIDTKYPNASVIIGMVGNTNRYYGVSTISKTFNAYKDGCSINGFTYMSGIENILHHNKYMGIDFLHSTITGYDEIAKNAYNFLVNGNIDYVKYEKVEDIQCPWGYNISGNTQSLTDDVWTYVNNDKAGIVVGRMFVGMQTPITINAGDAIAFIVSESRSLDLVGNQSIDSHNVPQFCGTGSAIITTSGGFKVIPIWAEMVDNFVFITFCNLGTSGWIGDAVSSIQIYGLHLEQPTMYDM